MNEPHPTILLVEDNDEDAFLLRRALRHEQVACAVQVAEDGQQAIDYLSGTDHYADRTKYPIPAVMLLDLKLPYVNGFEVLAWLATQPEWKDLKIIVLTSSGEERDRVQVERFGIGSYFVKPPNRDLVACLTKALREACSASTK